MSTTTWLLTWTTYGTWLPGDDRGFVSRVRDQRPDDPLAPVRREHDAPGTPYDAGLSGLRRAAQTRLKCDPIYLTREQAEALLPQFHETAAFRTWGLLAVAVMANHAHLLGEVPREVEPSDMLRDFKSYAGRVLNRRWGKPASGTWWTEGGSKRKKTTAEAVAAAVEYVRTQAHPLAVWVAGERGA